MNLTYNRRLNKEKVTRDWIAAQARLMFHKSRSEEEHEEHPIRLVASDPWVSAFMQRNSLSLRRRTSLTTLTDDKLVGRVISFMRFLTEHKPSTNFGKTVFMDETAIYFEDPRVGLLDRLCINAYFRRIDSTGF